MKKKFVQIAALCLSAALLIASGGRQSASAESSGTSSGRIIRVGLHHDGPYGTGALEGVNLLNSVGSGYCFGYYDSSNRLVLLGSTEETAISIVKTRNVYYGRYNDYTSYHSALTTSSVAVGDYHLELTTGTYSSFAEAKAAVEEYEGGFPAYIGGEFYARIGNYTTQAKAEAAQAALRSRGVETTIKGTSVYGLSVVITGTNTILFQFDDLGKGTGLGIEPNAVDMPDDDPEPGETDDPEPGETDDPEPGETDDLEPGETDDPEPGETDDPEAGETDGPEADGVDALAVNETDALEVSVKYTTWCKGYKYYGGFRFERINGGNVTVVNILDLEDYVKGVVPHEMSNSWPIEALKAQAVAARSYAVSLGSRHSEGHFDICDNTHCQAYSGLNLAGSNSDAAVDRTAGQFALYNNKVAHTYYYSSNGGASESVSVVWGSNQASYPYLVGKPDPYETTISLKDSYTKTVSSDTLVAGLKKQGYNTVGSSIVSIAIVSLTDAGNPKQVTFTDNNGKKFTLDTRYVKSIVGLQSYRYGFEASGSGVSVNGDDQTDISGLYSIDGSGAVAPVAGDIYVLTGSGTVMLEQSDAEVSGGLGNLGSTTGNNGLFTFIGKGWGHNVGMSQYGAYAMAKLDYNYLEILQFYYTGITVGFM